MSARAGQARTRTGPDPIDGMGRLSDRPVRAADPPEHGLVLSVDEKASVQAKSRKHPDQPPAPNRVRRREFEYVRHGTASLFAALDVHTGQVLAEPIPTRDAGGNNSVDICSFLDDIERVVDPALAIHVVLDNGSTHVSEHTRTWFDAHPRWTVHYTPPHASWVNQVELFFSILQRNVITNGDFTSRDDPIDKMLRFIADDDQPAKPFKWTYAVDPLVA